MSEVSGTCRYCGCRDDRACVLQPGITCCWIDAGHTVCSSFPCVRKAVKEGRLQLPKAVRRRMERLARACHASDTMLT